MTIGRRAFTAAALAASFGLVSAGSVGHVLAQETFSFTVSGISPPDNPNSVLFAKLLDTLTERSGGRLQFSWHPGNVLVPANEALEALGVGTVDMIYSNPNYYSGKVPLGDYTQLPYFSSGYQATAELFYNTELGAIVDAQYRENTNTTVIQARPFANYAFIMGAGKTVTAISDLKGKKIRSPGGMGDQILNALEAAPVKLTAGEFYTKLQSGLVDGFLLPVYTLDSYKLAELKPSVTEPGPGSLNTQFVWMNLDRWNALPADLQELFRTVTLEELPALEEFLKGEDAKAYDYAKSHDVEIIQLSDADRAKLTESAQPVVDDFVAKNGEAGQRIVDILSAL